MKRSAVILTVAALLLAGMWLMSGCTLEGDEDGDLLPIRGYGTLKLSVDNVGPYEEFDESGNGTGRYGFWYDADQDGDPDQFYQLDKPSGGIVALSFDQETGMADNAYPVAFARFRPGTTHYEIPLESLTSWIKVDQTIGYHPGRYVDEPNVLVYMDRLNDLEQEAALTGEREVFKFQMVSLGLVSPSAAGASSLEEPEQDGDVYYEDEDDIDFTPARPGEEDAECDTYSDICRFEKNCNKFAADWSTTDCKQRLFWIDSEPRGKRYVSCIRRCVNDGGCNAFDECKAECQDTEVEDVYRCDGAYGPEVIDIIYVLKKGSQLYRVDKGYNLEDGDELGIFIDYADVEGDFGGGKMIVNFGNGDIELDVPGGVGTSSFEDKAYIGFTVNTPLPSGDYNFTVRLVDEGCEAEGTTVNGSFSSQGQDNDAASDFGSFSMSFEMFEIYDIGLDKFNLGKGFVDVRSMMLQEGGNYLYELMEFDVAVIQAYFWSFTNTDKFYGLTWRDINGLIFTTTHDTRHTKYDETDDIQAMAFYIDQPMSSGLFTFYGDAGWNIYPKSPYGDNEDQPFIRGDLNNTEIHIPFEPYYNVDERYVGCSDTCDYWIDYIYGELNSRVRGYDSEDEAVAACRANSADDFWRGLFHCCKKAQAGINGCISIEDCIDDLPDEGNTGQLCDYLEDVYLKLRVQIDQNYLANDEYREVLMNEDGSLKLGIYAQDGETGVWSLVPGGYVTYEYGKTDYRVSLPYMPHVPSSIMQIQNVSGVTQSQIYIALVQQREGYDVVYGTGYYPENDDLDGEWFWLVIYSYNWSDPEGEGWTIGPVAGNTIYGYKNIYEEIIDINFGDARATGGQILPY